MRRSSLLCIFLAALAAAPLAAAQPRRDRARQEIARGDSAKAMDDYAILAANDTGDAATQAEYAYASALAGYTELSLTQEDRALLLDAHDDTVRFTAGALLSALGMDDAGQEVARPAPAWLSGSGAKLPALQHERPLPEEKEALAEANLLMRQKRYLSAADRFHRILLRNADARVAWAGYAIALEQLGAPKASAKAVDRDLQLREKTGKLDGKTREMLSAHKSELEKRPPPEPRKPFNPSDALKGRFLAFVGGNIAHDDFQSVLTLNGRVGKFITNRIDVGVTLGILSGYKESDLNGVAAGVAGRYNQPLPIDFPLNATLGARIDYTPNPKDKFGLVVSPGVSHFVSSGEFDLFLDIGLTGPLKNTQTLSFGYTAYFGGGS